jgi:hypothetical protein
MSAAAAHDVQALLDRIGPAGKLATIALAGAWAESGGAVDASGEPVARPLRIAWPGLGEVLPDGGLPRGVVELTAPRSLGGATSLALASVRAGQGRGRDAWCAWVDPEASLYAPGVLRAGVDLTRLLVVCPDRGSFGRTAVKVVQSGAFEVVVLDVDAIGGAPAAPTKRAIAPEVLVRKLALAAEPSGTTVLLLTDSTRHRAVPWPVALRLELERPSQAELSVRVAKDKRGRVGVASTIPFAPFAPFAPFRP